MNKEQFLNALKNKYAWPGGYPTYFFMSEGSSLCHQCCHDNQSLIIDALENDLANGWKVSAQDINWEDNNLFCDHCGTPIESSYGHDE